MTGGGVLIAAGQNLKRYLVVQGCGRRRGSKAILQRVLKPTISETSARRCHDSPNLPFDPVHQPSQLQRLGTTHLLGLPRQLTHALYYVQVSLDDQDLALQRDA